MDSNPDSDHIMHAGGQGDPDRDLDRLRLHGAESRNGSRKVVLCKWGFCPPAPKVGVVSIFGGVVGGWD